MAVVHTKFCFHGRIKFIASWFLIKVTNFQKEIYSLWNKGLNWQEFLFFFFFLLNDNSTHTEYILVFPLIWSSLVVQMVRNLPAMQDAWIQSLGQEDLLEKEMASHSRILAWRIPHTEEPGGLQSMESQTVRHDWTTFTSLPLIQFTWSSLNSINFMYKLYTFYEGLISLIKVHSLFWLSLFFLCLNVISSP